MQIIDKLPITVAIYIAGCVVTPGAVELQPGAPDCGSRSELVGLKIYVDQSAGMVKFAFGSGGISRTNVTDDTPLSRIPRNDPGMNFLEEVQAAFPREPGRLPSGDLVGFPASSSPDGRRWAAAIIADDAGSPKEFVVRDGKDFHRLASTRGLHVATLAWSPDSMSLAVIEWNYQTTIRGFRDFVSPHPVPYSDIALSIYRASGELICQSILQTQARYASVRAEWLRP